MSSSSESAIYGLTSACRALAAVPHDEDRFVIGTCTLHDQNELHVVEVSGTSAKCVQVLAHAREVWCVAVHDESMVLCDAETKSMTMHRLPREAETLERGSELAETAEFGAHTDRVHTVLFSPDEGAARVASVTRAQLSLWSVADDGPTRSDQCELEGHSCCGAWNPHHSAQVAVSEGASVRALDTRQSLAGGQHAWQVPNAHSQYVSCMDFNPNNLYYLCTAGREGSVKFWDVRATKRPVSSFWEHRGPVMAVKYNSLHDQLVLSASVDGTVQLYNVASICSMRHAALQADLDDQLRSRAEALSATKDRLLLSMESAHDDSVNACAWGMSSERVMASLDYSGRAIFRTIDDSHTQGY